MNEEAAFLAAIIARPDDDAPRLIFADWCEEYGDPDRAAFIRLQIAAAHLPEGSPQRKALDTQARGLFSPDNDCWLGPLRRLTTNTVHSRGFPEGLTVLHEVFLDHAGEILAAAPVRGVFLRRVRLPLIGRLAAMPELARVPELGLWHDGLSERSAELLAASPHLSGVRSLNLGSNRIRDRGARAVAASPHLGGLRELDLSDNRIGPEGALALASSTGLGRLEVLDLRGNALGTDAERQLRTRFRGVVRLGPSLRKY
jgi:uncharacterized protein (TIGR02996 family)